ncbi:hypothetical protein ABIB40_000964 [Pedobacter sp. UYP30]|uniref:SusD/RagB family nutrient-binding outer membrane lipoprotein n=1 Tax=Pedobacter sp. UYP30 TaxID=1756400 RepID=UPI00339664A5
MKTKYMLNPSKLLPLILIVVVSFAGCKKFLDVNQNPNNPDKAAPTLLLPTVEAAVGQIVGNSFQIYGNIWGQYWTQSPSSSQYKTIDQYQVTNTNFDRPWLILYRNALINADLIIKDPGANLQYIQGMAYVLKAYAFQLTTDAFGDVPLSEALKGNEFGSPKYDAQELVYDSIFNYIDKGSALLNTANASSPGAQDIIFKGDISKWKAFANTLKLRAYLRLSKVNPAKAQAGIAALYASNAVFLTEDAAIKYTSVGGNENPLYNEIVGLGKTQNIVASATIVKAFKANNDPRLFKFYDLLKGADTIAYIPQGSYSKNSTKKVSPPSPLVGGNANNIASATAPVKLISASESYFLQAEAVARGWAPTGSLPTLFAQGITASFTAAGLTEAQAVTYTATAGDAATALTAAATVENKVKVIITQKYYAMCGFQGFEAWSEWRRTGYPTFFVTSVASTLAPGKMPLRLLYPNSEIQSNSNFPGSIVVDVPVWWDK